MKVPAPLMAQSRLPVSLMAVMLVLVTIAVYWPATRCGFVNYDDNLHVTSNVHVQNGLTSESMKWAFQLNRGDYWHPLTWLSLMLDVSLFGWEAGGFHFTNVVFHAANSVLLFVLLRMLTGAFWRSVVVAALFALHPLRVESVAWVTERKDVLSGCLGLLALISYARYATRGQRTEVRGRRSVVRGPWSLFHLPSSVLGALSSGDYWCSLLFFACGLMSKAMLVTWPFVMLLLDYWPLQRFQLFSFRLTVSTLRQLVREKIPFFVLSGISCVLTYLTERGRQGAVGFGESPALLRLENAFVAYARYLGKTFWPVKLAVPYVNPSHWSWVEVAGSVLAVVGVCLVILWLGRRRPYLLVGWCWFWGTLIPVIGLTKGWGTFMADRFTYVPSIGVLILTVWGVCELTQGWRCRVITLSVAGCGASLLCIVLTRQQLGHWKDSETLFRHALEVTENNHVARINLGVALDAKGQTDEAIRQYQDALRLDPGYAVAHYNLGVALGKKGQLDEAIRQYQETLRLNPNYADAHNDLGAALGKIGQFEEEIGHYQEALRLKPDYALAHCNLGAALGKKGQFDQAIRHFREALRLKPDYADAHNNLGGALSMKGQTDEAIHHCQEALRLKPDNAEAHNNLGVAFLQQGRNGEAIRHFQEALRLKSDYADARRNLEAALATKAGSQQPPSASTNR